MPKELKFGLGLPIFKLGFATKRDNFRAESFAFVVEF